MRLPSIAERLDERFIQPLAIDRLCALLRPAVEEIRNARPPVALGQLEECIAEFTEEPSGAGFELPEWLEALDQELEQIQWPSESEEDSFDPQVHIPRIELSRAEIKRQIRRMFDD